MISRFRRLRVKLMRFLMDLHSVSIELSSGKCLIFLPHPDDEVFGMGGTIAAKVAAGAECIFIMATWGEKSHYECCPGIENKVILNRRREFYHALTALGLINPRLIELGLPDGGLLNMAQIHSSKIIDQIAAILVEHAAHEVFYPAWCDSQSDHIGLSLICNNALSRLKSHPKVYRYIVWGWFLPSIKLYKEIFSSKITKFDAGFWLTRKQCAINVYLKSKRAPCGNPYGGRLPPVLIEACSSSQEYFLS